MNTAVPMAVEVDWLLDLLAQCPYCQIPRRRKQQNFINKAKEVWVGPGSGKDLFKYVGILKFGLVLW